MIGGFGIIVEIDESAFGKKKYNKGSRLTNGETRTHWVFGGVERTHDIHGVERGESSKFFAVPVKNRKRCTLWPVIFKHIAPGTTIYSDGWKAYIGLDAIYDADGRKVYEWDWVNHSRNFVNPGNRQVHTQRCEGSWFHLKGEAGRTGTRKTSLKSHFASFIWRRAYGGEQGFRTFLKHVGIVFDPYKENNFTYTQTQGQSLYEDVEEPPAINFERWGQQEDDEEDGDFQDAPTTYFYANGQPIVFTQEDPNGRFEDDGEMWIEDQDPLGDISAIDDTDVDPNYDPDSD